MNEKFARSGTALAVLLIVILSGCAAHSAGTGSAEPDTTNRSTIQTTQTPISDQSTDPPDQPSAASNYESVDPEQIADTVEDLINKKRTSSNTSELTYDSDLAAIAGAHSADMGQNDYYSHSSEDGLSPTQRMVHGNYQCPERYGENLALTGVPTRTSADSSVEEAIAKAVVQQWVRSDPHREAMLNSVYEVGGVGVYVTEDGKVYVTFDLCG